jgi:hypothetical protein
MKQLTVVLRILAVVVFFVAALHVVLGLEADALLGAKVGPEVATEPSLSSQNRFYGVVFALLGIVLWLAANELRSRAVFFKAAMWVFFVAGVARLVAWAQHGAPAPLVVVLLASELVVPPALLAWYARVRN